MSCRIFFFHNPKAGGTSLRRAIETSVPDGRLCPIIENDRVGHDELAGAYAQHRGYDIYAGHYGRDIFTAVSAGHVCITNFRHPVSRLLSLYNFFRHVVVLDDAQQCEIRFRAVMLAKTAGFREFLASNDPYVDVYLRDQHFRQLTGSCWSLDDQGDVDEACLFIDAMPCYYVCEFPELSRAWMRETLALTDIPVLNVTGHAEQAMNGSALDGETCRLICAKNQRDIALYAYAVARLLRVGGGAPRP